MIYTYVRPIVLLACLAVAAIAGRVEAAPPELAPEPGVLLLRTGRVLAGSVIQVGDRYRVTVAADNEIGVPVDQVRFRCRSMQEAYEYQRQALGAQATVAQRLQLADWCLRYELLGPAAEQLVAATEIDPTAPGVEEFERRLRIATHRATERSPARPKAVGTPVATGTDASVADLPAGAIEQFTTAIQPLLVNRCAGVGCHGARSANRFRLQVPSWSRVFPRRFTISNLKAAQQWIDGRHPQESLLLKMATQSHGQVAAPIASRDVAQLGELAAWVHMMAERPAQAELKPPASEQAILQQRQGTEPDPSSSTTPVPRAGGDRSEAVAAGRAAEGSGGAEPATGGGPTTRSARTAIDAGRQRTESTGSGRDPFDPAVFNRRYVLPARKGNQVPAGSSLPKRKDR